jgi:hypothetical protein
LVVSLSQSVDEEEDDDAFTIASSARSKACRAWAIPCMAEASSFVKDGLGGTGDGGLLQIL